MPKKKPRNFPEATQRAVARTVKRLHREKKPVELTEAKILIQVAEQKSQNPKEKS